MSRYKTPLRYPGGKQRLAPFIEELLIENGILGCHYVEPYAGGAGVAMELLLSGKVKHVHLNDSSKAVYAFWKSILTKPDEFCRLIASASLSVDEWRRQKEILRRPRVHRQMDLAFSFFYLNRCNRSGIPSGGVIGGLKQDGRWRIDARFSRNELIRRIEAIAGVRDQISLKNLDAEDFILDYVPELPKNSFVYCDPPYFARAKRLYLDNYSPDDHARLAKIMQKQIKHRWVVSYDSAPEIRELYSKRRSFLYRLQYNANRIYKGQEIFIFSDKVRIPAASSIGSIHRVLVRSKIRL